MNSGAEAVESAIKTVRKWGYEIKGVPEGQAEIIICRNNFHGRTIAIIGFSSDPPPAACFGPFAPGFKAIPFGDADALQAAITPDTVGFLVEPIQGEAGVIIPTDGYLRAVREICSRDNVMLILDEIQTGGFKSADQIASKLGIEKTAMIRARAGITLTEAMDGPLRAAAGTVGAEAALREAYGSQG